MEIETNNFTQLNYGENPHQKASVSQDCYIDYEVISRDKELEYTDYLDLSEAIKIMGEFFDVNCAVITKSAQICSVALGPTTEEAFAKALDCDPVSVFEGTAGFSKELTLENAKQLKMMKIKNAIAPSFSKEAFSYLLETNVKMIAVKTPLHEVQGFDAQDIKVTPFGTLIQEQNNSKLTKETFKVVSQIKPSQEQVEDAVFGWKISKHLKSRSAVITKDLATRGLIQGKSNDRNSPECLRLDVSVPHEALAEVTCTSPCQEQSYQSTADIDVSCCLVHLNIQVVHCRDEEDRCQHSVDVEDFCVTGLAVGYEESDTHEEDHTECQDEDSDCCICAFADAVDLDHVVQCAHHQCERQDDQEVSEHSTEVPPLHQLVGTVDVEESGFEELVDEGSEQICGNPEDTGKQHCLEEVLDTALDVQFLEVCKDGILVLVDLLRDESETEVKDDTDDRGCNYRPPELDLTGLPRQDPCHGVDGELESGIVL